jgi:hypothetical protein
MTKVELQFQLTGPLDDALLSRIAAAHGIYGILRVQVAPSLDRLSVDYDASRLSRDQVIAIVRGLGIPAETAASTI